MKVVQFFALAQPNPRLPPGEHQFATLKDGRVIERYVDADGTASPWSIIDFSNPLDLIE